MMQYLKHIFSLSGRNFFGGVYCLSIQKKPLFLLLHLVGSLSFSEVFQFPRVIYFKTWNDEFKILMVRLSESHSQILQSTAYQTDSASFTFKIFQRLHYSSASRYYNSHT